MFLEADARKKGYITKEDIDRILTCKFRHKKHRNTWLTVLASFFSIHPQNQEPHSADFFHANMNCFYLDSSPQTNSKPKFASKNPNHARLRKKNIFLPKNCSPNHTKLKKIQKYHQKKNRDTRMKILGMDEKTCVLEIPPFQDIQEMVHTNDSS
eukprot:Sdes_comp15598_c0_seq2m4590